MRRGSASTSSGVRHEDRLLCLGELRNSLRFARKGLVLAVFGITLLLLPMTASADGETTPFPTIQSGFTSDLFGVAPFGNQAFGGLCGVGFGPDGSAWSVFDHSGLLAHFGPGTATANGTSLHAYSSVSSPAACGLTSLGDKLYANVNGGVQELDGMTGAATQLFATNHPGSGYGITVDPKTQQLVYTGEGQVYTAAPGADATLFSNEPVGFIDGMGFGSDSVHAEPYLFLAAFPAAVIVMRHDGSIVRGIPQYGADGIAVHGGAEPFVLVNNNDGRIYRLDFPQGNFENDPGEPTVFADNRGTDGADFARGDMAGVSPFDGCFYVTQQGGARYLDGTVKNDENSLVRICGGGGFQTGSPVLTVLKAGTGAGAVTSDPAGIDCGATCSHPFTVGTPVTLTATAATGSTFAGWSGGGCTGTGTCTVTLTATTSVTATFNGVQPTLSVQKAGAGSGTVTSTPAGIDCGATCTHAYPAGTTVTLDASPASGSTFAGWSGGGCSGSGSCVVTLTADTTVTATFEQLLAAAPGKIVYSLESATTRSDIWSVNPDGTGAVNVTQNDTLGARTPSLSPDGRQIVFAKQPLGDDEVLVINADGTGLRNVTDRFHPAIDIAWDPTWSSDGTRIAFKGGPQTFIQDPADVYVVNADGTGALTQVTHLGDVQDAAWSPVDDRIAFTRLSDRALSTVRSDGTDMRQVFQPPSGRIVEPAWSPDGTQIVFEYQGSRAGCGAVIARVNSNTGGGLSILTNTDAPATCSSFGPSWSPDGTQIVFSRSLGVVPDYRNDLFIVSATAGESAGLTRVTATLAPNKEQEPDWGNAASGPSPAATQTALNSSANPSVAGQFVTYTATVTADAGIPAGSMTFSDGASAISGCQASPLSGGRATCTLNYASIGSHSVRALYLPSSGDFLPSSSSLLTQTVNKAATTSTLTVTPPASAFGQQVTLTAAVTADAPSTGTPTGTAGFFDGATPLGSGTLDGAGHATLLTSALLPGAHSLSAVYAGDGNYLASTSAPASAAVATVPGTPAGVTANAGNASATVTWNVPATDGGRPITGYVVTPYVGAVAQAPRTTGNVGSTTISGLTNGTTYTFTVAATNAVGNGAQSAASNAVTPTAPLTPPTVLPRKCVVPNVIGRLLPKAKAAIKKASCRVGKITFKSSTRAKKNRVLSERPRPGKRLRHGAFVNLTVGRGRR